MLPIRVDFYLLASNQRNALWLLACRLLEKSYIKGHRVYVLCTKKQEAQFLDELLWTFKEDSFIPHHLQGEELQLLSPIHIAYEHEHKGFNDILLNLSNYIPPFYTQFKRVIELVPNIEAEKAQSRVRYKEYKEKGCQLQIWNLDKIGT